LIVEALLFASDKPLTAREIRQCVPDADMADVKSALRVLQYEYEAMGRSFVLKEVAKGFQFRSRNEYGAYILKMLQKSPSRLSRAAMETLAIIAYKQPVLKQEVERFRGVDVGGILKTLLEKQLIKILGRKDLPGRPLIYGTTKRFLEVFDLKNIESLPKLKEIKDFGSDEDEPQPKEKPQDPEKQETAVAPDGTTPIETPAGEVQDQQNPLPGGSDVQTEGGRSD
jgi:segregation and condensation protein B